MSSVFVVGSCSVDLFVRSNVLPSKGETVIGQEFFKAFGGKGANQAVQCGLLSSRVYFLGCVGRDSDGDSIRANLVTSGVDTTHLASDDKATSGVALIEVEVESGANRIVVVPGANMSVTRQQVVQAIPHISKSSFLVSVLEIPLDTVAFALSTARQHGVRTVLNPSPVPRNLSDMDAMLEHVDYLVCNEGEAAALARVAQVVDAPSARDAAQILLKKGVQRAVVVTLGPQGAVIVERDQAVFAVVSSPVVKVVDTTGAGDSFLGACVHFLNVGLSLKDAAAKACQVAAMSCEKRGCQPSYANLAQYQARVFQ